MSPDDDEIAATLLDLAAGRGRGRTFCPSEAARALATDWRPLMPRVRAVGAALQARGRLQAFRNGAPVDPAKPGGPIRFGLPPSP
jgi:hypothetical protein